MFGVYFYNNIGGIMTERGRRRRELHRVESLEYLFKYIKKNYKKLHIIYIYNNEDQQKIILINNKKHKRVYLISEEDYERLKELPHAKKHMSEMAIIIKFDERVKKYDEIPKQARVKPYPSRRRAVSAVELCSEIRLQYRTNSMDL